MPETESGWLEFVGWLVLKYVGLVVVLTGTMLFIDPFYFEMPLAEAEAGLEPAKAPPPPFTTSVIFAADRGDPVKIALGAREALTMARVEVFLPSGQIAFDSPMEIPKPDGTATRHGWQSFLVGVPETGSYTVRITQQIPGVIKIFLFQGPFSARLVFLPCFSALLLLILHFLRRSRSSEPALAVVSSR